MDAVDTCLETLKDRLDALTDYTATRVQPYHVKHLVEGTGITEVDTKASLFILEPQENFSDQENSQIPTESHLPHVQFVIIHNKSRGVEARADLKNDIFPVLIQSTDPFYITIKSYKPYSSKNPIEHNAWILEMEIIL